MIHVQEGKSPYIEILCMHVVRQASVIMYQICATKALSIAQLCSVCTMHVLYTARVQW